MPARSFRPATCLALLSALILLNSGCDQGGTDETSAQSSTPAAATQTAPGLKPVKVGVIGLTCEAPIFVAAEKGFFKEEGLDAELVKSDWKTLADSLNFNKIDVTHTLVMYILKPIENGADLKITAGVHKGCLRIQAGTKTEIKSIQDLKGKRIGIPNMGSPPHMFASRVLASNGIDPADPKSIVWKQFPPQEQGLALDKGEIDAVATSEPIGTMLLKSDKVRNVVDQAVDAPYKDEYCCAVVVSGKFASRDPDSAAKVTRAILKAAKWVQTNPTAAATLSVEKKHLASNPELNALALSKLTYVPSVSGGEAAIPMMGEEMKKAKLLGTGIDVADLSRRAFLKLDGVSDDWLNTLTVERVAGGGPAPEVDGARWAELVAQGGTKSCCTVKQN